MRFERDGNSFDVSDSEVAAIAAEILRHRRPDCERTDADRNEPRRRFPCNRLRVISGCRRCASVCVLGIVNCKCCNIYGVNSGGGTLHYPDDKRGHVVLMTADEFLSHARLTA